MKNQRSKWLTRLSRVECPDTTYISKNYPTVLKKGAGVFVTDVDNKKYLDFISGFGVLALGHRPQTTLQALRKQSARLIHGMGDVYPTEEKIKLLELLAKITPFAQAKSLLGLSGGDAVEIAIKTAMIATNRSKFISFAGGYHGVQLAPLHLNHTKIFTRGFETMLTNHAYELPFPYFPENGPKSASEKTEEPSHVLNLLEDALRTKHYAALVLEPIQGRGGTRILTKDFLQTCQSLCKKYGTLLVFDEIFTGFGRTGKMFAYEHTQVVPDLMCLGKAMGGGLPLSACVGDTMDVWDVSKGEARHTQTFLGHPLACAVGYETILTIKRRLPEFQKELLKIDAQFENFMRKMDPAGKPRNDNHTQNDKHVNNDHQMPPCFVRGLGFMRGLYFYTQDKSFGPDLIEKLYTKNCLTLAEGSGNNVLALNPALIATHKHYQKMLTTVLSVCQ